MFDFDDLDSADETTFTEVAAPGSGASAATGTTSAETAALGVVVDKALKLQVEADAQLASERFVVWCFKYPILQFPIQPKPRFRVFCFHNAGSAESAWTGPALKGPQMNPLMAWVKERGDVELVAPSYPGRDRTREMKPYESALALSAEALRVFHGKLSDGVPFAFWGHSVGTWVAFELLVLMRRVGLPMPEVALMNAFVAPHMPEDLRPWRCSRELNDADMKKEIVRWDPAHFDGVAKAIFDEPTWSKTWLPLMRADFKLFDEYQFTHDGMPKFNFPISAFHFSEEVLCRSEMVRMWEDWTSSEFTFEEFEGKGFGHLSSMYSPSNKNAYFAKATAILERFVP